MKSAIIIAKNLELNSVELLRTAAQSAGFNTRLSYEFQKADLLINRRFGMDYDDSDLDVIDSSNAFSLNPTKTQRICRDKWFQKTWMDSFQVKNCPTFKLHEFVPKEGEWMLKTRRGMQGRGVSRYKTLSHLQEAIDSLEDKDYIVQKALSFDKEYRCNFIGDEVIWFEKEGGNLFQGGSGKRVNCPGQGYAELSNKIKKELGLRFGAVDLLSYQGEVYPIDINCYPGVELIKDEKELLVKMFKKLEEDL